MHACNIFRFFHVWSHVKECANFWFFNAFFLWTKVSIICLFCVFLNNGQITKMNSCDNSCVHTEYQHHRHKCVIISDKPKVKMRPTFSVDICGKSKYVEIIVKYVYTGKSYKSWMWCPWTLFQHWGDFLLFNLR